MGHYVHVHVCFACDDNGPVAEIARKYLEALPEDADENAKSYLAALSERRGTNPGGKGGLSLWGVVADHFFNEEFIATLRPFWAELLRSPNSGLPHDFEHIMVFVEHEQSEAADAYEIMLAGTNGDVEVRIHKRLPFCWNQS